ncbi:MAG: energy transducer TonB, partial [Rhodobacteraceae bacterium]|nr:energy transducer TonB [Paracoccaceae bacterium]
MRRAYYISGAGHVGLLLWLFLGGLLSPSREPFEMTEVSVVTGAEFEAILAAQRAPEPASEVAQPEPPAEPQDSPEVEAQPDAPVESPPPVQADRPASDPAPEVTELALPPEAEVSDAAPELPEPPADVAVLA